ncbi:MAG TPA: hypothetical protein VJU82_12945, partial [Acidobacteriaceae bacterium]|nr:hypothetical protein [Acidobacteriaceae bacterium]
RPMTRWLKTRSAFPGAPAPGSISRERRIQRTINGYTFQDSEWNCSDGAFANAANTLEARQKSWGADSPELQEWIRGQDAVFSNCAKPGDMPAAAAPDWKPLLRQDRAYQIAAAEFYAARYDDAIRDFDAIGKDKSSPWSRWGEYLAARAEVRKAAELGDPTKKDQAGFDPALLQSASQRLRRLQSPASDAEIRHAAAAELSFVRVRLDPAGRLQEVAVALAGPGPDAAFEQDSIDLDWLMDHHTHASVDLVQWIESVQQSATPADERSRTLPWLVAELMTASPSPALMQAAAQVPSSSPAYQTVSFYRARRLLASGDKSDARTLLTTVLSGLNPDAPSSTRNGFLEQRLPTSRTFDEFLADAPRNLVSPGSSAAFMARCANRPSGRGRCNTPLPPQQFDADATAYFNAQFPLPLWEEAATGSVLPKDLRDAVAWAAWLRALGLNDASAVARLSSLLPEPVRSTAGASDGFPATLALLRNPGFRPYLEQGVQRSVTYSTMDQLRDNWWCNRWGDASTTGPYQNSSPHTTPTAAGFLTGSQRQQAQVEIARLNALPNGTIWLGQRALAYLKAHPEDPDAAEALALVVRATHYSCSGQANDPTQHAISKEAFGLLQSQYPNSSWAEKTKYSY